MCTYTRSASTCDKHGHNSRQKLSFDSFALSLLPVSIRAIGMHSSYSRSTHFCRHLRAYTRVHVYVHVRVLVPMVTGTGSLPLVYIVHYRTLFMICGLRVLKITVLAFHSLAILTPYSTSHHARCLGTANEISACTFLSFPVATCARVEINTLVGATATTMGFVDLDHCTAIQDEVHITQARRTKCGSEIRNTVRTAMTDG